MLSHFPFNTVVQHSPLWLCTHNYSPLTSGSCEKHYYEAFLFGFSKTLWSVCLNIKEMKGIIHCHQLLTSFNFCLLCETQKEILGKMFMLLFSIKQSEQRLSHLNIITISNKCFILLLKHEFDRQAITLCSS